MDFKKSVLALLALGLTGVASAGGYMPAPQCTNHPVTVPCEQTAWDIGFTGYWGRISSDQMVVDFDDNADGITRTQIYVKPDYKFGFNVEASYHWSTGNDLTANWTHFKKSFNEDGDFSDPASTAVFTNEANFKFDAVNLEMGQQINVGPNWNLRAHFGGQYMKLDRDLNFVSAGNAALLAAGTYDLVGRASDFKGAGLRGGFDAAYPLGDGWKIVGSSAVTVLAGELEGSYTKTHYATNTGTAVFDTELGSRHVLVAGIDGKLGLGYTYAMSQGAVTFEGGYAATVYANPILVTSNLNSQTAATFGDSTASFGVGSYYLTLKYVS